LFQSGFINIQIHIYINTSNSTDYRAKAKIKIHKNKDSHRKIRILYHMFGTLNFSFSFKPRQNKHTQIKIVDLIIPISNDIIFFTHKEI